MAARFLTLTAERPKATATSFLVLTYSFSWLVWLPALLSGRGWVPALPWLPLFALGTCGPMLAAVVCRWRQLGWQGVVTWLRTGFNSGITGGLWGWILLPPLLVPLAALSLYALAGGTFSQLPLFQQPEMVLPTLLLMLTIGGAQEEFGWRGYLLPELDRVGPAWCSDLCLVGLHSLWHGPLFFITGTGQQFYPFWVFLVFGAGFTLLINGLARRAGSSLLVACLFHGLMNSGLELIPLAGPVLGGAWYPLLIAGLLLVFLALWQRISSQVN